MKDDCVVINEPIYHHFIKKISIRKEKIIIIISQIPHTHIKMKSSCIAPSEGNTGATKEKDPSTLLQEPMIKEAIARFDQKSKAKRNS